MQHVIAQVKTELKRDLHEHELEMLKVAYDFGRADAISKAQEVLPQLKRRVAEEALGVRP